MSGKTYLRNQNFFKRNYFEAIKYIIPSYLYEDDVSGTPKSEDLVDTIINSHIDVAKDFSSILNVSAVEGSVYSSINTLEGIAPFFVKQNELSEISTQEFEDNILSYFGKNFKDYKTVGELENYLDDTLLPAIRLNDPNTTTFSSIGSASAIHNYLITKLSWMYFLNTSGPTYDPSSYVKGLVVSSLFNGDKVNLNDCINGLSEHLWRNGSGAYYPSASFASGTRYDLSGTQQLEKLKTWNDVIYSPLFSDNSDFRVRDKFETYIDSDLKSSSKIENGPFARLIRALSFFAFDSSNETEGISTLYDLDDCPDDYLPLVAQLIGWDLFGNDPNKWRLQLRNAVGIYKTIGTKKAVQSTVNTIFPKDTFPIEGKLTELWESYVPYLIYYALATESDTLKSFDTWTPALANSMGVLKYATSSMDTNIRLCVDKILYDTVNQFPERFPLDIWKSEFDLVFNYRGRTYEIPPFEEYPYYANIELDQPMIEFIADRLACFGVREQFALDVSSYITSNAITGDDEPRLSSWLIFTSGYNSPPNFNRLLSNINDTKIDYVSLWSGKSSHFKLVLQSSDYDFTKKNLDEVDSGDAVVFASKAIGKTAPAHSIPLITLEVSGDPDRFTFEASCLPHVYLDSQDIDQAGGNNVFASGVFLDTYKRGINTDGNVIGKAATQSLVSPQLRGVVSIGDVPRNTSRRRSYEKVMPFNGYYDRTGFNMPVSFDMASGLSGIPLGLIPSSLSYTPVSDHVNLPDIWAQCEGLNSNNTYYEYDVSNTQNVRGQSADFQANTDRTTDRSQLPGIYAAMHRISENQKDLRSFLNLKESLSGLENYLKDLQESLADPATDPSQLPNLLSETQRVQALLNGDYRSYTTSSTNNADAGYTFPAKVEDYYYFEFGRDLHRLHHTYQDNFKWHRLSPDVQEQDGANIFSHTFGPLLYNHDFDRLGDDANLVASSFANPTKYTVSSAAFTGAGSFAATATSSMYIGTYERISSGLVDSVEMVLTSGLGDDSSFSVIKVPGSQRATYEDPFMYDKTFVLMRSGVGAATRMRFDISKYAADSSYPIATNFLSPEHEFKVTLESLTSKDSGLTTGGKKIGIWIHTKPEEGQMWTYTPEGDWVQHSQLISRQDLLNKYSHTKLLELKQNDPQNTNSQTNYQCLGQTQINRNSPILGLSANDFEALEVTFDTRNRDIRLPYDYQKEHEQLHRLDQNYVIEIFMAPGNPPDEFMVVDKLVVQDLTMKKMSEIFAAGTKNDPLCVLGDFKRLCEEYRVELTKQDLFDVFKHFNNLSGKNAATAFASRDKDKTETIMESEGGSRIDYRYEHSMKPSRLVYTSFNTAINTITFDT